MPNLFLHTVNIYVADGATDEWDFRFDGVNPDDNSGTTPYLHPDDVKVQVIHTAANGNLVVEQRDRQLIAPNRVRVLGSPIPAGYSVKVYRETENRYPLVDYRDMQTVGSADLDLHARQTLFVAMEAIDVAFLSEQASARAEDAAGTANAIATEARTIASEARDTATAANATADAANATAAEAEAKSDAATQLAEEAKDDAQAVRTLAEQAGLDAQSAAASAAAAATDSAIAVSTANAVDGKAQSALDNSVVAVADASEALDTANAVDGKAQSALDAATIAESNAATALSTANGVDAKAQSALDNSADALSGAAAALERANHTGTQPAATISDFSEAVRGTALTGLPEGTAEPVIDTDTVLSALAKLKRQVYLASGELGHPEFYTGTRATLSTARPGRAALDGTLLSRTAFADLWAFVQANFTVVSDADWLNTSLGLYGHFSSGDGSTTFRIPDWNGAVAGHKRRVARGTSGDGGGLTEDAMQGHSHTVMHSAVGASATGGQGWIFARTVEGNSNTASTEAGASTIVADGVNGTPRVDDETRAASIDGIWLMRVASGGSNPGTVDVTALASEQAAQSGRITTLEGNQVFTREYVEPDIAWTVGGNITINHNLGLPVKMIEVRAVMTTAASGLSVGNEVSLSVGVEYDGSGRNWGIEARNLENIYSLSFKIGSLGLLIFDANGAGNQISPANCRLKIRIIA